MKRTLLAVSVAACAALAGCGSTPAASSALPTAAPTAAAVPPSASVGGPAAAGSGIPPLGGTPTDLKAPPVLQPGTGTPPAGLLTQDVVVGTGPAVTPADTVDVRYSGALYDGTPFDSSWSDGEAPITFPLSGVVPGFAQGIEGMQAGGRRQIVIPPDLGYGAETNGPIPGGSTLVFVVDLVSIS